MDGPLEMLTLVAAEERYVIVGRGKDYPYLIIDPDNRKVTPAASPPAAVSSLLSQAPHRYTMHDNALWRIISIRAVGETAPVELLLGRPGLLKASFPDLNEQVVLREAPVGVLASHQGSLYIVGDGCWRLIGSGPQLEEVVAEPPWQFDNFLSTDLVIASGSGTQTFSKPAPPAGRDPYRARLAFSSTVYGLLVSASAVPDSGDVDDVLYQVAGPAFQGPRPRSQSGRVAAEAAKAGENP